jgi:hypothetical protein
VDLLRNLFGNLTSGIIRLAVTGGILVLCYLFIVKPVLDTTSDAIRSSGIGEIGKSLEGVGREIKRQVRHSLKVTKQKGVNPKKLIRCIETANGNTKKIQRCTRKF